MKNNGEMDAGGRRPASSGGKFLARHDGDASFYELEANTVKDLRQAVGDVREAQPEKKKK